MTATFSGTFVVDAAVASTTAEQIPEYLLGFPTLQEEEVLGAQPMDWDQVLYDTTFIQWSKGIVVTHALLHENPPQTQ